MQECYFTYIGVNAVYHEDLAIGNNTVLEKHQARRRRLRTAKWPQPLFGVELRKQVIAHFSDHYKTERRCIAFVMIRSR